MSLKKWVYVAEILLEVCKTLLPYVKARTITINRDQSDTVSNEDSEQ